MNKQAAKNCIIGIVLGAMTIGLGIGVVLASVPFLVYNNIDGLVIIMIGMVVMFLLEQRFVKSGYEIRIDLKKGGENEQTKT